MLFGRKSGHWGNFSDVTYFIYIFFGGKFSTPKNNFLSIYFLPKSSSWLKIAIMEYRIDLKASEAVQAYTLQKANAAKTKHSSRRRTHHKIQK